MKRQAALSPDRSARSRPLPRRATLALYADQLEKLDDEPIVIRSSKSKAILLLVACLAFVALGLFAVIKGEGESLSAGLPAALVFGLGVAVAAVQLARPSILTITSEGVSVQTIFRTLTVRFDEVQGFFVYRRRAVGPSSGLDVADMAAFNWIDSPAPAPRLLRVGKTRVDGTLGPGWPLSAQHLTDLLNAARARASESEP